MPPKPRPTSPSTEPTAPGAAPPVDNSTVTTPPVIPATTPTTLVDEVANPAGPPEGVEQPSAAPEAHGDPTGPSDAVQPTQADLGSTTVTTEDEPPTPLPSPGDYVLTGTVLDGLGRLEAYLRAYHGGEYRDTQDGPEHPGDVAIRLLTRMGAAGTATTRCPAPYCNLPAGHADQHGWVHVEPGTARG